MVSSLRSEAGSLGSIPGEDRKEYSTSDEEDKNPQCTKKIRRTTKTRFSVFADPLLEGTVLFWGVHIGLKLALL